ncbi:uncharacterized protein LOC107038522 [Diachasma alloeum]|uniref:uncharacterized protein LOC107038522 n=1 Tax=Diachasma alloeum TaxID=454923 RepID=UPI00073843B4|nr:uncharacterized protein LOC107038522 [Diachasma alloeum]
MHFCRDKEVIKLRKRSSQRIMEQGQLRPDLQRVLKQFHNIKSDYCKAKINLRARDEIIELQKTNMEASYKRVEMIAKFFDEYKKKYQESLLKYQGENYQLTKRIEELESTCKILQQTNQDLVVEGNGFRDERLERLEDEVQILESRIAAEQQAHREEIEKLKAEYERQISDRSRVIEELNKKIGTLTQHAVAQKPFVHPALYEEAAKVKNRSAVKKKPPNTIFKWPSLEVEKVQKTPDPTPPPKRRRKKLFHADENEVVDLIE